MGRALFRNTVRYQVGTQAGTGPATVDLLSICTDRSVGINRRGYPAATRRPGRKESAHTWCVRTKVFTHSYELSGMPNQNVATFTEREQPVACGVASSKSVSGSKGVRSALPNNRFQPTSSPSLRSGEAAAESGRWAA